MAIYRETAHTLFGDGGTAYDNPKPAARTVRTPAPAPAAKPFTRDTTQDRVAQDRVATAPAETSFMAAPAYGERTTTARRSGSATRPLIIAGIAGVIALGVGAVVLMNQNTDGLETTTVATPPAAAPTPMPTPAPVETTAATPAPIPAAPVAEPRASAPAPARRAAAPVARRAAPATTPTETVTTPTGPAPYSSLPDPVTPPVATTPATPATPPVIAPEPAAPAPTPAAPEPTPVPQ